MVEKTKAKKTPAKKAAKKRTVVEEAVEKPISKESKIELKKAQAKALRNLAQSAGVKARVATDPDGRYDEDEIVRSVKGRWVPGYSGNPGAKPNGTVSLTTKLKNLLASVDEVDPSKDNADILVEMCFEAARSGDFNFFKEIFDRVEGKVTEKVEVTERELKMFGQEAPVDDI